MSGHSGEAGDGQGANVSRMIDRIRAFREAGNVRRSHTIPYHGEYTNGKHCYDALSLLLVAHPDPSTNLIKAVLWHDTAERWLGDLPHPAKKAFPMLGEEYAIAEEAILGQLGIPSITNEELVWLKAVDALEFWLWAKDQEAIGNSHVTNALWSIERQLSNMELPGALREIYDRMSWDRGRELTTGRFQ